MHRHATLCCQTALTGRALPRSCKHVSKRLHSSDAPKAPHQKPPRLTEREYVKAVRMTTRIIDHVANPPIGWKHTKTLRGEEQRIATDVKLNNMSNNRGMSDDKLAFEAAQDLVEEDDSTAPIPLPLGTFVETRRSNIFTHGVILGQEMQERRRRLIVLTTSGEMWYPVREDIVFSIPDFVAPDLVSRCLQPGGPEAPLEKPHINARIEVLKRLRELDSSCEKVYHSVCQRSTEVYRKLSSPDPYAWSQTSVNEVAHLISSKPNTLTLFATHKYLINNSLFFVANDSYELVQSFSVRPKREVDNIYRIQEWSRRRDGPIQAFAQKARKIISDNQKVQKLSHTEPPSYQTATYQWTENDKEILLFLQKSLRRTRSTQLDPYSLGQSFILKQLSVQRPLVDDDEVHKTLVDLGVLAPWQDLMTLEPRLNLDIEPEKSSSRTKAMEALVHKGLTSLASSTHLTPLGPEDFHRIDPLDAVRHDFGDLPVFVIDDAHAEELDDGVSIERIPSEPDCYWTHIHIADPASLIPRTHLLVKEAAIRSESCYFTHRSWPLFPRNLMKDPEYGLSLRSREDGQPSKVLSFSAKVNNQGEMIDFKVRAGLIRNVHVTTYNEVNVAMEEPEIPRWYPFGRLLQSTRPVPNLTESQLRDLRDLHAVASSIVAKRFRQNIVNFSQPVVELTPIVRPPPEISGPTFQPLTFRGFPTFDYSVADIFSYDSGAHAMVAEMAKLASRAASRFFTQCGIPAIRRVSDPRMMVINGDPQELMDLRTPNGYVRHDIGLGKVEMTPSGDYSLEPKAHYGFGLIEGEGYVRATSPLRRYLDLVTHWQLHHALLGSAAPTKNPPFSTDELSQLAVTSHISEKLSKLLSRNHQQFWTMMQIRRWAEGDAMGIERAEDPLRKLEAFVIGVCKLNQNNNKYHVETSIRHLGINADLEGLDSPDIPQGSTVPVKILRCHLGVRPKLHVALEK
ncbi:hypothetical protein H0H81_012410 [Sphagnurus paluster]|uniref:RNB domain-containing protein n=1 Tax=Sphagnurus paluster TaxID=117069 RepID=A0A9P7FY39_9AGAR|nr:hypothetical protein H0H81_012410 [Sphagnurus paluster]